MRSRANADSWQLIGAPLLIVPVPDPPGPPVMVLGASGAPTGQLLAQSPEAYAHHAYMAARCALQLQLLAYRDGDDLDASAHDAACGGEPQWRAVAPHRTLSPLTLAARAAQLEAAAAAGLLQPGEAEQLMELAVSNGPYCDDAAMVEATVVQAESLSETAMQLE
jgi:hypothetical protein